MAAATVTGLGAGFLLVAFALISLATAPTADT